MKYPKLRELRDAIIALIKGPYTSKFPVEPHTPHPNFRGRPKFDQDCCVGCLACELVCPAEAIAHQDSTEDLPNRRMIHYSDTCIFCGQCEAYCITQKGIKLSNEWELSFFDRKKDCAEAINKELLLCDCCGEAVACKDHLIWIAKEIGELAYSNPTLYMTRLKELGLSDEDVKSAQEYSSRAERMKVLCARCRRKNTLTTEEKK